MRHDTNGFRLAVFDVAGTTVLDGDAVIHSMRDALAPWIRVTDGDVREVMGLPKPQAIALLLSASTALSGSALDEATRECHATFRGLLAETYLEPGALQPVPGATAVFAHLRWAGVKVALDTGFSRDILDAALEGLGWQHDVVDCTVASDEVSRGRPFPDQILRAMALMEVSNPYSVAKIGDTQADIAQGLAAECRLVVGVTYGAHSAQMLERMGTALIERLDQLPLLMGLPT